ncbi:MAG TPA: 6,7-dimethyl-8-ribityllumazine synthase [Steroidobacteraceae bacterium]|nr:6,7-dimethyl-8-ribityllumazine synthase [Steroidobacteraceae bacterium]
MTAPRVLEGEIAAGGRKVAIVAARFNDFIVASLIKGASAAWLEHGGAAEDLLIARVPGAFELPVAARRLALSGRYDAVVALGCVIRGDTPHFEYVSGECARGLQLASLETLVPIIFGVLTVETVEQALERAATGAGNKGGEAMAAALEMASLMARLAS